MATSKVKMVGGDNLQKIEVHINAWLADLPATTVVERTETAVTGLRLSKDRDVPAFVVSIWYFE